MLKSAQKIPRMALALIFYSDTPKMAMYLSVTSYE
jgi:hypothetical protein